jgi:hypothetical protein
MKCKLVLIGVILIAAGAIAFAVGLDFENARYLCEHPRGRYFPPGASDFLPDTTVTATCQVTRFIGQDLTLWAQFIAHGSGKTIPIPVHIEIRDPDNEILVDKDFTDDDNIVLYVAPKKFGNYTASIRSLEDPTNRISAGTPTIFYAFAFLAPLTTNAYDEVNNPVGNMIQLILIAGGIAIHAGIGLIIYGGLKLRR